MLFPDTGIGLPLSSSRFQLLIAVSPKGSKMCRAFPLSIRSDHSMNFPIGIETVHSISAPSYEVSWNFRTIVCLGILYPIVLSY
jgi:hypothetical protein